MKTMLYGLSIFFATCISSCSTDLKVRIRLVAKTEFRKSLIILDSISNPQLDSFAKENPEIVLLFDSAEQFGIETLTKNGNVVKNELLLPTLEEVASKRNIIARGNLNIDTFFLKFDTARLKAAIHVQGANIIDSIQVDWPMEEYGLFLVKDTLKQTVVYYHKSHISNGDNYDFSFFGVK